MIKGDITQISSALLSLSLKYFKVDPLPCLFLFFPDTQNFIGEEPRSEKEGAGMDRTSSHSRLPGHRAVLHARLEEDR